MTPVTTLSTMPETVDIVRAPIARGRVAEMLRRGWTIVGPAHEGAFIMEGPEPEGMAVPLGTPVNALASRAMDEALARLNARLATAA